MWMDIRKETNKGSFVKVDIGNHEYIPFKDN